MITIARSDQSGRSLNVAVHNICQMQIMLKRPSATDTEEDLLAFQESFLASGSKPAASVAARSRVGEKRKQLQQEDRSEERERDVVQLQSEGITIFFSVGGACEIVG